MSDDNNDNSDNIIPEDLWLNHSLLGQIQVITSHSILLCFDTISQQFYPSLLLNIKNNIECFLTLNPWKL